MTPWRPLVAFPQQVPSAAPGFRQKGVYDFASIADELGAVVRQDADSFRDYIEDLVRHDARRVRGRGRRRVKRLLQQLDG